MELVQVQSWEIAFNVDSGDQGCLPQIWVLYHTLMKVNDRYYKAKVNRQVIGNNILPQAGHLVNSHPMLST